MSDTIVVIGEIRDGKLRQVTREALEAARQLSNENDHVAVILPGHQVSEAAEELASYTSGKVYVLDHQELQTYEPQRYNAAVIPLIEELQPDLVILGHTSVGRDIAPQIAVHLDCGQISDVISLHKGEQTITYTRPIYAGKALEERVFRSGTGVVTIRPNNFPPVSQVDPSGEKGEIIPVHDVDISSSSLLRSAVKEVVRKTSGRVDLTEAKIVVSGGRGVKSSDGFKPLEELAEVLHGAVGASRGACDAGYCDYSMQIGQTGKVVTPELYIACGISGAIQHLAGMSQSRIIIAINKDPEAPIFQVADYGIVGDLFEIVPLLTEQFKKILS